MKKFALLLTFVGAVLIPTLLLAQPPRPQMRPQVVQPPQTVRPTMQVHVPPPPVHNTYYNLHRPPVSSYHTPYYRPPVHPPVHPPIVQPRVIVVPQVIAPPPVIAPAVVVPSGYYPPMNSGFSLTIGGTNGVFSISTVR